MVFALSVFPGGFQGLLWPFFSRFLGSLNAAVALLCTIDGISGLADRIQQGTCHRGQLTGVAGQGSPEAVTAGVRAAADGHRAAAGWFGAHVGSEESIVRTVVVMAQSGQQRLKHPPAAHRLGAFSSGAYPG